jgi:hypothetical protein
VNHGGPLNGPDTPNAFTALIPTDREFWMSPEGARRSRETLGTPEFLSSAEESRWKQAGSPLPGSFDPSDQDTHSGWMGHMTDIGGHLLEVRRGVLDFETPKMEGFSFPDVAGLPSDPEELRLAVQNRQIPGIGNNPGGKPLDTLEPPDTEETIGGLGGILGQPNATPALRAAAFNALAEMPGIELDRNATDLVGRPGYAISYADKYGLRGVYVFDPETSALLGQRTVLLDPGRAPLNEGLPAGLAIRDVAHLQSKVVDSTRERPDEGESGGPTATTGPVYRR